VYDLLLPMRRIWRDVGQDTVMLAARGSAARQRQAFWA
jgi:hypothetical protein